MTQNEDEDQGELFEIDLDLNFGDKCLVFFENMVQAKYSNDIARDPTPEPYFSLLSVVNSKLTIKSLKADLPKGTYELKFQGKTGSMP